MNPSHRTIRLRFALGLAASALGTALVTHPATAMAAPQGTEAAEDEETAESEEKEKADEKVADDKQAGAGATDDDKPDHGGWGVGGEEPEGKYAPKGKTGKLKALDDEAEEDRKEDDGPTVLPPAGFAYLDFAVASGEIQAVSAQTGLTDVSPTASFLIGVGYRFGKTWGFSLRYGISTGKNNGPTEPPREGVPDRDQYTQIASGGLEFGVKPVFTPTKRIRLPVGLAITLPLGAGDIFADADHRGETGQAIVQDGAAASRGWRDRALFVHNRFGLTPSAAIMWTKPMGPGELELGADVSVDLLIRAGGNDPPPGEQIGSGEPQGEVNDVFANNIIGVSAFYGILGGKVIPGVRMWVVVAGAPDVKGTIDPGGASFVFEPVIKAHIPFGENEAFGMDAHAGVTLPSGTLGGDDSSIVGGRFGAGFFF